MPPSTAAVSAAIAYMGSAWFGGSEAMAHVLEIAASIVVLTGIFALIFKVLPSRRVPFGDVLMGALITAVLFEAGKFLIGLYLGKSDVGTAYGAAGSLVIVLIWVYYSSQILLFGAEFTQVYANRVGARIVPSENAIVADPEKAREPGSIRPQEVSAMQSDRLQWAAREATVLSDRRPAPILEVPWWVGLIVLALSALRSSRRSANQEG